MRRTLMLKAVDTVYSEDALRRAIHARDYAVVVCESAHPLQFTVYEPVTEEHADATLEFEPASEIRTDDYQLALYALYRPQTAARFCNDFAIVTVFQWTERTQKSRPAPSVV